MDKLPTVQKNKIRLHKRSHGLIILLLLTILVSGCNAQRNESDSTPMIVSTTPPQAELQNEIVDEGPEEATQTIQNNPQVVKPKDDGFDRVTMIRNIVTNAVMPLHETFETKALLLKDALHAFDAAPTMVTLEAAQQAWLNAADAWAGCQLFSTHDSVQIQDQISKWPTSVESVEKFIAEDDKLNSLFVASIDPSSKGLPAIEYLLFDPASSNDHILNTLTDDATGQRRRAFLVALADNLHELSIEAKEYWALPPNADGQVGAMGQLMAEAEQSGDAIPILQILMNGVSEQLEDILNMNLRGVVNAELGMPIQVEAPYSNDSLSHISRYLEAFKLVYAGGPAAGDLGLDDYLHFLQIEYNADLMSSHIQAPMPTDVGKPLADIVYLRIDQALAELETVEEPLADSIMNSPQTVKNAYDAALRLLILVRVDMVNNFGVTLTFNDGD